MHDHALPHPRVRNWRLEKRLADGTVFEVLEGTGAEPGRVTYRLPGVAPAESYAPVARGGVE